MVNANIHQMLPGGVDLSVVIPGGASKTVTIVPAPDSKRQKTRAGFCGPNRDQFCRRPWPTGLLGPKPLAPVYVPVTNLEACGLSCHSNEDCGGLSEWDSGCRCVVPKMAYIPDPVYPPLSRGRCLVLTTAILGQSGLLFGKRDFSQPIDDNHVSLSSTGHGLSRRDTNFSATTNMTYGTSFNRSFYEEFIVNNYSSLPSKPEAIDEENPPSNMTAWFNETALEAYTSLDTLPNYVWCACNCTYVSWGCCESRDGIVHEPASYNKGVIANCTVSNSSSTLSQNSPNITQTTGSLPDPSIYPTTQSDLPLPSLSSIQSSAATATSSEAWPTVCTTKCRSAVRACQWWCKCNAPPVGLFFWFEGTCGPRPQPNSNPNHIPRAVSGDHYTTNSTARQLLGTVFTSDNTRRPPGGAISGPPVLGYKATMDMIPGAPRPAPCNESYVSYACADSEDGIVQEGPEFWLGALLPENATALPPASELWLRINGLQDSFNNLNKMVT